MAGASSLSDVSNVIYSRHYRCYRAIKESAYLDLRLGHIHVQVEAVLVAVVVEVPAPVQLEGVKTILCIDND